MLWAEMVMCRNGHGPKWLWAEMTRNPLRDFRHYFTPKEVQKIILEPRRIFGILNIHVLCDDIFVPPYRVISCVKSTSTSLHSESDLNSLLVKRQIDNPSPGAVTGGN